MKKKNTKGNLGIGKNGGYSNTRKEKISKIQHLEIEPQTKLMGKILELQSKM